MRIEEEMAIAVLRGDMVAAKALADIIVNELSDVIRDLPPVKKITVNHKNIRVLLYAKEGLEFDYDEVALSIKSWLAYGEPMIVTGYERIEIYEINSK